MVWLTTLLICIVVEGAVLLILHVRHRRQVTVELNYLWHQCADMQDRAEAAAKDAEFSRRAVYFLLDPRNHNPERKDPSDTADGTDNI